MKAEKKILMIEDDIFLRKIYRDKLTRAGFDFAEATNGVEGISKIISERPDLVLLDLILPFKNGFEVLAEMKMDDNLKKIPVIIFSNLGQESDIEKGKALGAVDYLVKADFSMKKVIEKIKFHLAKSKISRKK